MDRNSSEIGGGTDRPAPATPPRDEIRRPNAEMAERLVSGHAQQVTEGRYAPRVIQTCGRVSDRPRRTPLGVVQHDGSQYVVSPERRRDRVRNLTIHPDCWLLALQVSPGAPISEIVAHLGTIAEFSREPREDRAGFRAGADYGADAADGETP